MYQRYSFDPFDLALLLVQLFWSKIFHICIYICMSYICERNLTTELDIISNEVKERIELERDRNIIGTWRFVSIFNMKKVRHYVHFITIFFWTKSQPIKRLLWYIRTNISRITKKIISSIRFQQTNWNSKMNSYINLIDIAQIVEKMYMSNPQNFGIIMCVGCWIN